MHSNATVDDRDLELSSVQFVCREQAFTRELRTAAAERADSAYRPLWDNKMSVGCLAASLGNNNKWRQCV